MDVEHLLFESAREDVGRQVLEPREHTEVEVVATVPAQHVYTQKNLALSDLFFGGFALAKFDATLVQDAFDQKLEEAVGAGAKPRLAQLPIGGDELRHHAAGLLETLDACRAGVPVFKLSVVGEARQRQEKTELTVIVFGWTKLFQSMETLHGFLHGQLQLREVRKRNNKK